MKNLYSSTYVRTLFLTAIFLGLFLSPPALAECLDYNDYLHWVGGVEVGNNASAVATNGTHAYVLDSYHYAEFQLRVVSLGDPENPQVVGGLELPGSPRSIELSESYVFVGDHHFGLYVIDISNPGSPALVSSLDMPDEVIGITVIGTLAYVANSDSGLKIVDITDPLAPELIGGIDASGSVTDVAVQGNLAYAAGSYPGLLAIDVSDPTSPLVLGSLTIQGDPQSVELSGSFVYLAIPEFSELKVVDATDPSSLQAVATLILPGDQQYYAANDLALSGNDLFAGTSAGLHVVDISDPLSPAIMGRVSTMGLQAVAINGSQVCIAAGPYLQIVDALNPHSPAMIGSAGDFNQAQDITLAGNYAYVADGFSGLKVVELSDPEDPSVLGEVATSESFREVVVSGTHAFVIESFGNLQIMDVSDPVNPEIVATSTIFGEPKGLAVFGDHLFVLVYSNFDSFLRGFDISDPTHPYISAGVSFPESWDPAFDLEIAGSVACFIQGSSLRLIDFSNPASPSLAGSVNLPTYGTAMAMTETHAFVAVSNYLGQGLHVVDIIDPDNPYIVSSLAITDRALDLVNLGSHVYMVTEFDGLQIVDISDLQNPHIIGSMGLPDDLVSMAVTEDFLYLAPWENSFAIFPVQCDAVSAVHHDRPGLPIPVLGQNYPNPFNPTTRISFVLPAEARVTLRVFDLSGHLVRTILREAEYSEGPHEAVWDGRDETGRQVSSGAYFYRLETGSYTESRNMILIK